MYKYFNYLNIIFNFFGINISRFPKGDIRRRFLLFKHFKINKVIDVGANTGEYSIELKKNGFKGIVYSFEPISDIFLMLRNRVRKFKNVHTFNFALGDSNSSSIINVSRNLASSSLLSMLPKHLESEPDSSYFREEKIEVKTLDSIFNSIYEHGDRIFLKIDTQGFEMSVLNGAKESLKYIVGLQVELSFVSLYNGGPLFQEVVDFLTDEGFSFYSIENGFSDKATGQLLQVDGIFFKDKN